MIALDYREPRPCVRLSLLHVLLPSSSLPIHRSGVNLCPNLIIHICQPASCNVPLSLSLFFSFFFRASRWNEGGGEKNKHPAPRKWGYITININGSPVSSNFQPLLFLFFLLERVVRSRVHPSASIVVFIGPCSTKFRVYYRGGGGGGGSPRGNVSHSKNPSPMRGLFN